jgi:hypothetical protein
VVHADRLKVQLRPSLFDFSYSYSMC